MAFKVEFKHSGSDFHRSVMLDYIPNVGDEVQFQASLGSKTILVSNVEKVVHEFEIGQTCGYGVDEAKVNASNKSYFKLITVWVSRPQMGKST